MTAKYANLAELLTYRGRRFAERCTNCGECLNVCPLFPLTESSSKGPQAAIEAVTDLLKGGPVSDVAYEVAFSCTGACGICAKVCSEKLLPYMAFPSAIARIVASGRQPPALHYQYRPGHRYNFARVFSALQMKPSEARWLTKPPENPEPVDVVFFGGCSATGTPHTLMEIVDILDSMDISYVALAGGDICCGSAPLLYGDVEAAQSLGERFVSAIAAFRPKKAVFFCTGCHMSCVGILPRFVSIPFESCELTQFLVDNLDRIPFKQKIEKVVTLHDSCSVARLGTFEAPRTLLKSIPGLKLVEMEHNRADALCCGGVANTMRPEITREMRLAPMKEARFTGADVMTTICTGCQESFAPLEDVFGLEVRSYVSLVAEALGKRHPDNFKMLLKAGDVHRLLAAASDNVASNDLRIDELEQVLPAYLDRFCLKPAVTADHDMPHI